MVRYGASNKDLLLLTGQRVLQFSITIHAKLALLLANLTTPICARVIIYNGHLLKRYSVTYAVWKFTAITIAPLSTSSAAGVTRSEVVEAFWRGSMQRTEAALI
ncbi:hypothetical protein LSAT2_031589 [Lamellibrachia satsuma]|nr:hypothetical protein LSAT2_031589 [Lamellibrachia satsuma]